MKVLFIAYNNGDFIHVFPQNLAYLVAALEKAGHSADIWHQDIYRWPDHKLTELLDDSYYDVVGIGACGGYWQYKRAKELSAAINASKRRKDFLYIGGGHLFAPDPGYFIRKMGFDTIFDGEADTNIKIYTDHYAGRKIKAPMVMTSTPEDIDRLPWPAYDRFPMEYYSLVNAPHRTNEDKVAYVLSARGCTFSCNFCYRMTPGYRVRNIDNVMEEIKFLQERYGITHINFNEELLMGSEARAHEVCSAIERHRLKFKWACDGRLNYAKPEVLKHMKDTGCVFINYGIEAYDDRVLKNIHKGLNCRIIKAGVENTLEQGISPGLNILWGNIGDTKESLEAGVKFLLKYGDGAQMRTIRPVTGYPGTELYKISIERGMVKDIEDFYENKHTNSDLFTCNFMDMPIEEAYKALSKANQILIKSYYAKLTSDMLSINKKLYAEKNKSFRGYRRT